MQHDEDEVEASRQAALEEERKRAAIAHKGAAEQGMDPKTKRIVKHLAEKYSAWVELHGAAVGLDAAVGPTVDRVAQGVFIALLFESEELLGAGQFMDGCVVWCAVGAVLAAQVRLPFAAGQ